MLSLEKRKLAIRWHNEGRNQQTIASLIGCNQGSISRLIKKYQTQNTLEDLPRSGRPTKLNKDTLDSLRIILKSKIEQKNAQFGSLTTKQLRKIIHQKIGELYSIRHIERIMHKLGFSLITPRTMHTKHDKKAADAFREDFKKKSNQSIWVMS